MSKENKQWEIIKQLMKSKGWILQELIKRTGITRTTFFNIQHNKSRGSYETYLKIAKAFGVDVDVLFGKAEIPNLNESSIVSSNTLPENLKFITVGECSFINVPLVKKVTCCIPIDTRENIESFNYITTKYAGPNDFMFEITNDDMAPVIQNKDVVHINRNEAVNNGDLVCLALKDHSEALIRYYKQSGEYYEFNKVDNDSPIVKKKNDFVIFGKVARIIRNF